jgi:hypothetical protein
MEELGEELADEVQHRFPDRGCILAGYSFGASMASAAVRTLEQRSIPVHRLYLVAPMPLDTRRLGPLPLWLRVDGLDRPLDELKGLDLVRQVLRDLSPLTRRPYERLWRYLKVKPKRRLLCRLARHRQRRGLPLTPAMLDADVRQERFRLHREFSPVGIETPTVIFNPRDGRTDAAATWRGAFGGSLTVIDIPDPHDGEAALEGAKEIILSHIEERQGA